MYFKRKKSRTAGGGKAPQTGRLTNERRRRRGGWGERGSRCWLSGTLHGYFFPATERFWIQITGKFKKNIYLREMCLSNFDSDWVVNTTAKLWRTVSVSDVSFDLYRTACFPLVNGWLGKCLRPVFRTASEKSTHTHIYIYIHTQINLTNYGKSIWICYRSDWL